MDEILISKANGVFKINYSFETNILEKILEIRGCIEILEYDIKIDTTDQYMYYSLLNFRKQYAHCSVLEQTLP